MNLLKLPGMKRNHFITIVKKILVLIVIMKWNVWELMLIGEQNAQWALNEIEIAFNGTLQDERACIRAKNI